MERDGDELNSSELESICNEKCEPELTRFVRPEPDKLREDS